MISRSLSFLRRYIRRNGQFNLRQRKLKGADGDLLAYVDRLEFAGNTAHISGWAKARELAVVRGNTRLPVAKRFVRHDVPGASEMLAGFSTDILWNGEPLALSLGIGHDAPHMSLRRPGLIAQSVQVPVILARLGLVLLRNRQDVYRAVKMRDRIALDRLRAAVGMSGGDSLHRVAELPEHLFDPTPAPPGPEKVTVVVPVYDAFDLLPKMLDRVTRNTDLPMHLIIVEDASPDPRVRPWLRDWSERAQRESVFVELLENPENLGFIGSVNRAFERALAHDAPVILLNSDAMVPPGWVRRLVAPISADPSVASVTPMSNDAEIFSAPVICQRSDLAEGHADGIDAVAKRLNLQNACAAAPTGVGFCMALNPDFLRRLPTFDTEFGRGYGEEVDWCQKARALGGKHLGVANLFVEHRGGASFGSDEKLKLVAQNNARVASRYPRYDAEVQKFIASDPLAAARHVLGLAWASEQASDPLAIFVGHALGGGSEHYLKRRVAQEAERNGAAVVLRLGGALRWQVELHGPEGAPRVGTWDVDRLIALFQSIGPRRVIYSCGVGDPDPVTIPSVLLSLIEPGRDTAEILFHDFFPISPSYTLLDKSGHYRGVPQPEEDDPAHQATRPDGSAVSLAQWRRAWGELADAADTLTVFCGASRDIVAQAFLNAAHKIELRPHADVPAVPHCTPPNEGAPTVGVLGDIGLQKGAELLQRLGPALATQDTRLAIIGNVDPAYPPAKGVSVHGRYALPELDRIAAQYNIGCWFIPSIWPETFSYTTHEALASGLPVFAFDLGGQGEAVARAKNGHILPLALADDAPSLAVALIRQLAPA